jgi:hypothetical protein
MPNKQLKIVTFGGCESTQKSAMSTQTLPLIKNYIDREQLQQIAATCDLWVQFGAGRITLFAADKANQRIAGLTVLDVNDNSVFQKGLFELRSWLEGLELYGKEYSNMHIVIEAPQYSIVPEALFVAEKADAMLAMQHDLPKFSVVKNNRIAAKHCVNVYSVPEIFLNTVKVLFPQADVHHYAEFLLLSLLNINDRQHDTLYINMHQQYMDVVHLHGQELRFINTFETEADTDIIYFILSVAEQQKISGDKLSLVVTGDVNANGSLISLLRKYVPEVALFKRVDGYSYPASFREFQDQQYFTATSVLLCE